MLPMKMVGNVVILAAGIPLLLGIVGAVAVLFVSAFAIVLCRKIIQVLGMGNGGGMNLANPSEPRNGV
jgi:hypothetical protein